MCLGIFVIDRTESKITVIIVHLATLVDINECWVLAGYGEKNMLIYFILNYQCIAFKGDIIYADMIYVVGRFKRTKVGLKHVD